MDARRTVENPLPVAEGVQVAKQPLGTPSQSLRVQTGSVLDVAYPLMQNLPDEPAESMGDGPDGLIVT